MNFVPSKKKSIMLFGNETRAFASFSLCALFLGLIALRDLYGVSFSPHLLTVLSAAIFMLASYSDAVAFLCMLIPLTTGIPGTYILTLAYIILFFRKNGAYRPMQLVFPLFFIFYEWVLSAWDTEFQFDELVFYGACLLLLSLFIFDGDFQVDYKKAMSAFLLGASFFTVVVLIVSLREVSIRDFFNSTVRFGDITEIKNIPEGEMHLTDNANNVGYYSAVSLALYLTLLFSKMSLIYKAVLAIPAALCVFGGILTVSRTFALVLLILVLYYIVINLRFNWRSFWILLALAAAGVAFIFLIDKYPEIVDRYTDRFDESVNTIADDRFGLMIEYNDYLTSHDTRFFFGTGIFPMLELTGMDVVPHNGLQQIFVAYGMIGFMIFIISMALALLSHIRPKMPPLAYWTPLLAVFVFTQTLQFLDPHPLMLPLIPALFALRLGRDERSMINNERKERSAA